MTARSESPTVKLPPGASYEVWHEPMGVGAALISVLVIILWGGTSVSNQFATDVIPPLRLGGDRFLLAAIFMYFWCRIQRASIRIRFHHWPIVLLNGGLLFAQIGTFNIGTYHTSASHSSILVNSYIFWVTAYEALVQKRLRLRWWQLLGLLLAAAGCGCLLFADSDAPARGRDVPTLKGDLILAVSGLLLGIKVLVTKWSMRSVPPGPLMLWHDVTGAGLFFLTSILLGEQAKGPMTMPAWIAVLFGGVVVSGFCYAVNAALLRRHGASQVSVFSFGTPICGVALGVLLRGDELSTWLIVAGVLVALGIFLVNVAPRPSGMDAVS